MLMLALALSAASPVPAIATPAAQSQAEITLSSRYRRALILGLEREIGGKFVITGLAGAQAACGELGSCVSGAALSSRSPTARVASYDGLLKLARVDGEQPAAIVSLRSARAVRGGSIELLASVYDASSNSWSVKKGVLKEVYNGNTGPFTTAGRLQSWSDAL